MKAVVASERQPDRVLLIGCSRGSGLTYYNTVLAIAMERAGIPVVVLSTAEEQSSGLHAKLATAQISVFDDPSLDVADLSSIRRAARVVREGDLSKERP